MNDAGKIGSHTPGPWCVETRAHPGSIDICTDEHEPWFIAEVCKSVGFDGFDGEANARLIAAAPDLLEICKRQREELRLIRMKDCGAVYDVTVRMDADIAISKAEGR
jgi:hypothetical protein